MDKLIPTINLNDFYLPQKKGYIEKKINVILKLLKSNAKPFTLLDKFHEVTDDLMKKAYKGAVCKEGCSHCCYVAVAISKVEAQYIADRTGHKMVNPPQRHGSEIERTIRKDPCPFLKNNRCSIYKYRPTACRVFTVFDSPEICADPTSPEHLMVSLLSPGEGGHEAINALYLNIILHIARNDKNLGWPDEIREFFK